MSNYIDWLNETKGIDQEQLKPSFLRRNLMIKQKKQDTFVQPQLRYKIQQESYHLYYIVGSEDVFYRPSSFVSKPHLDERGQSWHDLIAKNNHITMNQDIYRI